MSLTAPSTAVADHTLTDDLLNHLDVQLASARRMRQIVLEQASAIRRRAVRQVVSTAGELQVEMHRRELLERERMVLMERAGRLIAIAPAAVGFSDLAALMDPDSAQMARSRTDELRGLLRETEREHELNRRLLAQELSFLDHLLGLAGHSGSYAAGTSGVAPRTAEFGRIRINANLRRRVFDVEA